MKWNSVVTAIDSLDTEQVKEFLENRETASYQLVDVRQPEEYNREHLPGAELIPLLELMDGFSNLDRQKPTIVYCLSGGRSLAAARWLVTQGFLEVYDFRDGMEGWRGEKASGHQELNLNLIDPDADFPDALSMAYAMEEGLRLFYIELAREATDEWYKKLYRKLASFEVTHKQKLSNTYFISQRKELIQRENEKHREPLMEGGGFADITLIKALADASSVQDIFSMSIALETQALDFYVRLSRQATNEKAAAFFLNMADEEKKHLTFVTKEMDRYLQ